MVRVGQAAPGFTLPSTAGPLSLASLLDEGPVVLLFYNEDSTPLCERELSPFVSDFSELEAMRAKVLGVSADDVDSHGQFARRLGAPFPLASDTALEVARAYGVIDEDGKRSRRAAFVIGRDGRVLHANSDYNPGTIADYEAVITALANA